MVPKLSGVRTIPDAEEPLPDAVDEHAGGQRVFRTGEPVGELATAALGGRHRGRFADRGDLEEPARDGFAEVVHAAPDVHPRFDDRGELLDGQSRLALRPSCF